MFCLYALLKHTQYFCVLYLIETLWITEVIYVGNTTYFTYEKY